MSSLRTLAAFGSMTGDARTWLDRLWSSVADRGQAYAPVPAGSAAPLERTCQLAASLLSGRGEASGAAIARDLLVALRRLAPEDRAGFFGYLAEHFTPDPVGLRAAAEAYLADPTAEHASRLSELAEPPRQELLRRMNMAPGGTAALVEIRSQVLGLLREHPNLRALDTDLKHLLGSWFNRGFLELRRIDWQTPAAVLERLIAYEAVHEIQGWDDLRRRLAPDRRCFGFFHPALPGDPLIFVEVALTQGLAASVQPLLARAEEDAAERGRAADTAIFYSISNCQAGLRGISFGNFLIKQVVEELRAELPTLVRFSTLSPVPGFRSWLDKRLETGGLADGLGERLAVPAWWEDSGSAEALREPLLRLCAAYLTEPAGGRAMADPVARFHLGNGARLERINWLGNTTARGMRESWGIMVNYLYDPERIEANHEAFVRGTAVRSASVDKLLAKEAAPPQAGVGRRFRKGSGVEAG